MYSLDFILIEKNVYLVLGSASGQSNIKQSRIQGGCVTLIGSAKNWLYLMQLVDVYSGRGAVALFCREEPSFLHNHV